MRYKELMLMEAAGLIFTIKLQETFVLQRAYTTPEGERIRAITYTCDYSYKQMGERIIEDVKAIRTQIFDAKWKMMKERYPVYIYKIT